MPRIDDAGIHPMLDRLPMIPHMARQPAPPPLMQISAATAIKAGFFGAIGFFVAQLVLVPVAIVLLLICGVSVAGLGVAASKIAGPPDPPARFAK